MDQQLSYQKKEAKQANEDFSSGVVIMAKICSVIFHPLLLLLYSFIILAWCNPYLFGRSKFSDVFADKINSILLIWLLIFSFLVPILAVLMMKGLGLIKDLVMSDKTDRIGPYIIVGLLYIVIFMNMKNNSAIPIEMAIFSLGATIGIFAAFVINLFSKISMHTVGMGGFLAMMMICVGHSISNNDFILILAVIAAGLVGSSRLILGAHEPNEIYGGYAIGFLAQFVALSYLAG
jgi:membrane-associated phospholipid phosphatase